MRGVKDDTTFVTLDDPVQGGNRKRLIKVNGRRSLVRGQPWTDDQLLQWVDTKFLSNKPWSFTLSLHSAERSREQVARVWWVRSVDKAKCRSKLDFFNNPDGVKMIGHLESCDGVISLIEARVLNMLSKTRGECEKSSVSNGWRARAMSTSEPTRKFLTPITLRRWSLSTW